MAQIKKEEIRVRILRAAKREFLRSGYREANLRDICRRAEVPIGNLYNYFDDKDALFVEVLRPQLDSIMSAWEFGKRRRPADGPIDSLDIQKQFLKIGLSYILQNREELDLLLNRASGSSLELFPEEHLVTEFRNSWSSYFDDIEVQSKTRIHRPSPFLFEMLGRLYLETIRNLLKDGVDDHEFTLRLTEVLEFSWHGHYGLWGSSR